MPLSLGWHKSTVLFIRQIAFCVNVKGRLKKSPIIYKMPAILEELQAGLMACESGEPSKEFYSVEERVVR